MGPSMEITNEGPYSASVPGGNGIVPSQTARIEVIGVGGGGSNAVNRMIASDLQGVGYKVIEKTRDQICAQVDLELEQAGATGLSRLSCQVECMQRAEVRCAASGGGR